MGERYLFAFTECSLSLMTIIENHRGSIGFETWWIFLHPMIVKGLNIES